MFTLTKKSALNRADEIKNQLLSGKSVETSLARLYLDLGLLGKYSWIIQVYRHLLLYIPQERRSDLYHPALMQAFLKEGDLKSAREVAGYLLSKNPNNPETQKLLKGLEIREQHTLPPYTPLASLSRYAAAQTDNKLRHPSLPAYWIASIAKLTPKQLQEIGYFTKCRQLKRAPHIIRKDLQALFDELTLNYLFQNHRAVAALSGAMLELLLAFHLQKKTSAKQIFDLNLNTLIDLCAKNRLLPAQLLKLGRTARLQRNFIHPGKNIQENRNLSPAGTQLCFFTVLELIDAVLGPST